MNPTSPRPPLTLPDFQRIARVLAGLLQARQGSIVGKCLAFALGGAHALRVHHDIQALPVAGRFALRVTDTHTMAFAPTEGADENFHAWVQADDWLLDFSAIAYPATCAAAFGFRCDARVFQKQALEGTAGLDQLGPKGSFCFAPDPGLTSRLFAPSPTTEKLIELAEQAAAWYKPSPKKFVSSFVQTDFAVVQPQVRPQQRPKAVPAYPVHFIGIW